jgi:hypothetical protein
VNFCLSVWHVAMVINRLCTGSVWTVEVSSPPYDEELSFRQPYCLLVDPLSSQHLLFPCVLGQVFRLSLTDGSLTVVAGTENGRGGVPGSSAATTFTLKGPANLVEAPRELYREGDALVLLMSVLHACSLCLLHVPYE